MSIVIGTKFTDDEGDEWIVWRPWSWERELEKPYRNHLGNWVDTEPRHGWRCRRRIGRRWLVLTHWLYLNATDEVIRGFMRDRQEEVERILRSIP